MALLKSLYLFSLPILFSLTIGLAFFAVLTTISAFTVLLCRLLIIYTEIGFTLIPHYLFGKSHAPSIIIPAFFEDGPQAAATPSYVRRLGSSSDVSSAAYFVEQQTGNRGARRTRKASLPTMKRSPLVIDHYANPANAPFALPISTAPPGQRDFEGLGGWRLDAGPEETVLWTSINSRLELPGAIGEYSHPPNHQRRATSSGSPMGGIPAYNSVVSGKVRHSSTSLDFNLRTSRAASFSGILVGNTTYAGHRRVNSKSANDYTCTSPNTSRPRTPGLSVTLSASPEANRKSQRRTSGTKSTPEDYFSGVQDGSADGLAMKKRSAVEVMIDPEEEKDKSGTGSMSVSSASSRASGSSEGLSMKVKP